MALYLEELKQVFREQEQEQDKTAADIQRIKAEAIKARQELEQARHELNKAKAQAQQEQARERLAIARARERRAEEIHQARQQQAERQRRTEAATFWASVLVTLGSLAASVLALIFIILKG